MKVYTSLSFILILLLQSCSEPVESPDKIRPSTDVESKKKEGVKAQVSIEKKIVDFWQLVSQQKTKEAVEMANELENGSSGKIEEFYAKLFKDEGIDTSLLGRKEFNEVDFFFWSHAQYFKSLANDINLKSVGKSPVKAALDRVQETVKSPSEVQDLGVYPVHIWNRKFGSADRQLWVLCELIYQMGGEGSIIYLRNPETKVSPHTICEVFFKGKHYIIDIQNNKFIENTKFTELTPEKIKEIWPEKKELHNTFKAAVRLIPAMPIDYSERNQRLNARLGKLIKFAEPPQNRYHFWKKIYPSSDIRFWEYPIRILKNTEFYKNAEK